MRQCPQIGRWFVVAVACALAACASGSPALDTVPSSSSAVAALMRSTASGKISHVVVIIQENRSFDDLFQGYPGADTQSFGYNSKGRKVTLAPISLGIRWDVYHDAQTFFAACNGKGRVPGTKCRMNGFDKEQATCGHGSPPCPNSMPEYAYVPKKETKPYFSMAKQYVLADEMFASNFDGSSFISHQYAIAGQAGSAVDYPLSIWGCDGGPQDTVQTLTQRRTFGPSIVACFDYQTLGDELDAAGISWKYYTASVDGDGNLWNAYQAVKHIRYGPDWNTHVIFPQTRFFKDVSAGKLPAVSWVTPTCGNSDHAGCGADHGPSWVASLVNAIGKSSYWNSTAIFIFWDDYGGWYDHVPPAFVDYDGLGFRVPMLVISPYAKQGYVTHVHYEHGSILKFIEDRFRLARLAASDTRAASPAQDCFDFSQSPRPFVPIVSPLHAGYFETEPLDPRPVDNE